MQLEITAKGMRLTDTMRSHVERRIRFALGRFVGRIERVHVRIADENGPKGGLDKSCRVRVRLIGLETVVVEHVDAAIHAAIDGAADHAGRTVARNLDRDLTSMRDRGTGKSTREKP